MPLRRRGDQGQEGLPPAEHAQARCLHALAQVLADEARGERLVRAPPCVKPEGAVQEVLLGLGELNHSAIEVDDRARSNEEVHAENAADGEAVVHAADLYQELSNLARTDP